VTNGPFPFRFPSPTSRSFYLSKLHVAPFILPGPTISLSPRNYLRRRIGKSSLYFLFFYVFLEILSQLPAWPAEMAACGLRNWSRLNRSRLSIQFPALRRDVASRVSIPSSFLGVPSTARDTLSPSPDPLIDAPLDEVSECSVALPPTFSSSARLEYLLKTTFSR